MKTSSIYISFILAMIFISCENHNSDKRVTNKKTSVYNHEENSPLLDSLILFINEFGNIPEPHSKKGVYLVYIHEELGDTVVRFYATSGFFKLADEELFTSFFKGISIVNGKYVAIYSELKSDADTLIIGKNLNSIDSDTISDIEPIYSLSPDGKYIPPVKKYMLTNQNKLTLCHSNTGTYYLFQEKKNISKSGPVLTDNRIQSNFMHELTQFILQSDSTSLLNIYSNSLKIISVHSFIDNNQCKVQFVSSNHLDAPSPIKGYLLQADKLIVFHDEKNCLQRIIDYDNIPKTLPEKYTEGIFKTKMAYEPLMKTYQVLNDSLHR